MKTIPTVQTLRQQGFKVTVNHYRDFFRYNPKTGKRESVQVSWHQRTQEYADFFLDACGGKTEVFFLDTTGNQYNGKVECSKEDLYSRKIGVKKAIARAYADYLQDNKGN